MNHGSNLRTGVARRRSTASISAAAAAVIALAASAGCTCTRNTVDTTLKYVEAKAAYDHTCQPDLPLSFLRHYERGWRCGYLTVAKGGDTCPPAVPPQTYWRHKYESVEGRQYVVTWYDGWRAGAATAKSYGADLCHKVPALDPCSTCNCRPDCDCRTACNYPTGGVLPNPGAAPNAAADIGAIPVPAPTMQRLPPIEPEPAAAPQPTGEEVLAPPPAE